MIESKTITTTGEKMNKKKVTRGLAQTTKDEFNEKEFMGLDDGVRLVSSTLESLTFLMAHLTFYLSRTNSLRRKNLTFLKKRFREFRILSKEMIYQEKNILGYGSDTTLNKKTRRRKG